MTVALTGYGCYRPPDCITGAEIADRSGIPEEVVREKMGIREKRVCPPDDDHVTDMCVTAAERALADADVDLVLYPGSEYKDYVVWSAAANVAERIGAENAYATENHTLCASTPVSIRQTAAQLRTGDIRTALHVTASRENDLLDYTDRDASFMFNFGSGGARRRIPGGDQRRIDGDQGPRAAGDDQRDIAARRGRRVGRRVLLQDHAAGNARIVDPG